MQKKLVDVVRKLKTNAAILQYTKRDFGVWRQVTINSVLNLTAMFLVQISLFSSNLHNLDKVRP